MLKLTKCSLLSLKALKIRLISVMHFLGIIQSTGSSKVLTWLQADIGEHEEELMSQLPH